MDFKNPRRGAAGVSIVWMVCVIVLFFVAIGIAFVASGDQARALEGKRAAEEGASQALERAEASDQAYTDLSKVVGWGGDGLLPHTDMKLVETGLSNFKSSFPDMDDGTIGSIEKALSKAIEAYNNQLTKIRNLEAELGRLQGEIASRDAQLSSVSSSKDSEIDDLRSQLTDQKQSSDDRIANLENERENLRNQVKDKDRAVKTEQGKLEDLERRAREAQSRAESRMAEAWKKLAFTREPEAPDGEILAVSADGKLGWINLGNRNRLARGTKFRVVSAAPGAENVKARAEVLHIEDDMAQVLFFEVADEFAPPVTGDIVFNPVYDPRAERFAILLGRFSGTWNEGELTTLLTELNITVQDTLDKTTDYVIVGGEMYADEEGEPLEDPLQASELPEYKDAVALGVQVVTLKDIRDYFGPR